MKKLRIEVENGFRSGNCDYSEYFVEVESYEDLKKECISACHSGNLGFDIYEGNEIVGWGRSDFSYNDGYFHYDCPLNLEEGFKF